MTTSIVSNRNLLNSANPAEVLAHVRMSDKVKDIDYNPKWENGTGYLDFAVRGEEAPKLAPHEVVRFETTQGRIGIIVGSHCGNIVVFKRYSDPESSTVVVNTTGAVPGLSSAQPIDSDMMRSIHNGIYSSMCRSIEQVIAYVNANPTAV
jgi:hypothetical protein